MHRKFSTLLMLPVLALLLISTAPQATANLATQLTSGTAELIGTVSVADLPIPTEEEFIQVNLPLLFANQEAVQQAKTQGQSQSPKSTSSPSGSGGVIRIQKNVEGIPGYNPNPCVCTPPDMGIAASSKHVFQQVNLAGAIYSSEGRLLKGPFSLSDFWFLPVRGGPLGIGMSDPIVLFDAAAGRWYSSIINVFQVNRVRFAVSATSDPTGIWYIYQVATAMARRLPDQPYIGYTDDKFLITANDFDFDPTFSAAAYTGVQYWILNKAQMMAGNRFVSTVTNNPPDNTMFTLRPAQHLSSTPIAYMVANCLTVGVIFLINVCPFTGTGGATVLAVSGTPPGPTTVTQTTTPMTITFFPPDAEQPGTSTLLATNDNRILSAVWQNSRLWFALNDGCIPIGDTTDRSCARLVELQTSGTGPHTLLQDFDLAIAGAYVFYPALSTDSENNMILIYGQSSTSLFPSLFVTGQLGTAPAATLLTAKTLILGSAPDLSTRYGDYFWAATVPGSPKTFWVAGEYRAISLFQGWQTRLGLINLG